MANDNIAAQLGELKGTVATFQANITTWMEHWSRQDAVAMTGRRDLYQRVERLSADIVGMNAILSSVQTDVQEIKTEIDTKVMPTITSYKLVMAHRAGMWLASKFFWALVMAFCTVAGFIIHEGVQYLRGALPFTHP